MNRTSALVAAAATVTVVGVMGLSPDGGRVAAGPGLEFAVDATVMIDDGTDTCSASDHAVSHNGSATVRYCVTLSNTGSEALSLHDVQGSSLGQLVGPADATIVEPGSSWSVTATALETEPHVEWFEWTTTGVDSGVETVDAAAASVYIQLQGAFPVQLDMTAMIDDGTDTCGTATDLAVAPGSPVRFCYTMTNTRALAVAVTFLYDEHVGFLPGAADSGGVLLPELEPGESRVVTNVAVVDESATWAAHWAGIEDVSESIVQGTDSVTLEVVDPAPTTTAPCVAATTPPPTSDAATTTQPPTTTTETTTTTSTTTTTPITTTTTTTLPFGDPTTTTTTSPVIVVLTTTTTLGEPAGFARRAPAAAPCPETPPGGGALPATGSPAAGQLALALGLVAAGALVLSSGRWRRP